MTSLSLFTSDYARRTSFDLLRQADYQRLLKEIKKGRVRWLHLAPPCVTFSKARRSDKYGRVPPLRDRLHPMGFRCAGKLPQRVVEANLLLKRTAALAIAQARSGGFFSIENPATSLLWETPASKRVASLPGVVDLVGDQCVFGGLAKKATCWRTNAPWLWVLHRDCPGWPEHQHRPLDGFTYLGDGSQVWSTSLAAEYPEYLCDVLAKAFMADSSVPSVVPEVAIDAQGAPDAA